MRDCDTVGGIPREAFLRRLRKGSLRFGCQFLGVLCSARPPSRPFKVESLKVKALVLEQRRFKAGTRPASKAHRKDSAPKQETDPDEVNQQMMLSHLKRSSCRGQRVAAFTWTWSSFGIARPLDITMLLFAVGCWRPTVEPITLTNDFLVRNMSSMAPPYEELRSTLAIWFDDESVHCKQRREVSAHCLMSTGSPCSPTRNRRANRLLWVMRHMGRTGDAPQRSQQWQTSATASRNHFCCIAIDRCFKIPGPNLTVLAKTLELVDLLGLVGLRLVELEHHAVSVLDGDLLILAAETQLGELVSRCQGLTGDFLHATAELEDVLKRWIVLVVLQEPHKVAHFLAVHLEACLALLLAGLHGFLLQVGQGQILASQLLEVKLLLADLLVLLGDSGLQLLEKLGAGLVGHAEAV
eukprot:s1251_g22.t1